MIIKFETHVYECEGELYQQVDGCPTGLRPSGPISMVTMDKWLKEMRKIEAVSKELTRINPVMFSPMEIILLKKYVDDVLFSGQELKCGVFWDRESKSLRWSQEREQEDRLSNTCGQQRTMKVVAEISSQILECLDFTWDTPLQEQKFQNASPNHTDKGRGRVKDKRNPKN